MQQYKPESDKLPTLKTPQQTVQRIVKTVLEEVFQDEKIPQAVRRRAQAFSTNFEFVDATYLGPEARRAAGRDYDAWSDDIFQSIQTGDCREDLLQQFIQRLGLFFEQDKSDALFALVVEEITNANGFIHYQLVEHLSHNNNIHENHWLNYANELAHSDDKPFFRALLDADSKQSDIGVWYAESIDSVFTYQDEFDDLIQVTRSIPDRLSQPLSTFWLSAIKLESEEVDQPHRLVFIAYPNHGTVASPKVGRAAAQEWRMLQLLRIAYRQVDHETRDLDRRIAAQRVDMLRDLGPGFFAHELHTHLANLHDLHVMMIDKVTPLLKTYPQERGMNAIGEYLVQSVDETSRIFQVVKGYNNLMRAKSMEQFTLLEVIEEMLALTRIRSREYAQASVQLERKRMMGVNLETDHGLLLVVLVNVIINATQAIYECRTPQGHLPVPEKGERIIILMESQPEDEQVQLIIANTGPAILPELHDRIFRRGFTTRSLGHGQGLYLCRQILNYLGGSIHYIDPTKRGLTQGAGFQIEFMRSSHLNSVKDNKHD